MSLYRILEKLRGWTNYIMGEWKRREMGQGRIIGGWGGGWYLISSGDGEIRGGNRSPVRHFAERDGNTN